MQLPFSNLQIKHWNPGASMPLILPVHVVCNTSEEAVNRNIEVNSRRPGAWLKQEAAHGGVAVLCGSGPSLATDLDEIKSRVANGATLFAMNGSAKFLHDHGLLADYQLLLDPRPQTAELIGPACEHLFASQVDSACFDRVPHAMLWHLQVEGIDDLLPPYDRPFTLIGAASSVGTTATIVAYALGYRTLHVYGYDSSHQDGRSHAFRQEMNDGEPCASVTFNGREYRTSLTMKMQAERFQETARLLEGAGCTIHVHGSGLLPDMWHAPVEVLSEREKYERMWSYPAYRVVAPGEHGVSCFLDTARPINGCTVVDFGCGTGRAALKIKAAGFDVLLVDFAANCRDPGVLHLPFLQFDLTEPMPVRGDVGFCADAMEHIAPENVETVTHNIMTCVPVAWFQISTVPDVSGAIINQRLHLTVEPHEWWLTMFARLGYRVSHAQVLERASQFLVERHFAKEAA